MPKSKVIVGHQTQQGPKSKVGLLKEHYLKGEPIGVKLTFWNPTSEEIQVCINYPTIGISPKGEGIHFREVETGLELLPVTEPGWYNYYSFRVPCKSVPPEGEWSSTIYLQRFLKQPQPGRYCLPYDLELSYYKGSWPGAQVAGAFCCQGELVFTVEEGPPHELIEVLKTYEAGLYQSDFWKQREAREALLVAETPEVVPFLVRMLARSEHHRSALEALGRFRDHPVSILAVVDQAKSDDVSAVAQAVELLTEWKYVLETELVQKLLNSEHSAIRAAALRYVDRMEKLK